MDERLFLPSASSRGRDKACPGALNLIRALRTVGIQIDGGNKPWTESGNRIHAAVAGEDIDLEHDEESARETVEARLTCLRADLSVPDNAAEIIEQRIWLFDVEKKIASGKPDRIWLFDDVAVIPDVKTGWINAEAETSNPQLRGYAVLAWHGFMVRYGVRRVIVALAQAHGSKPQPVEYDEAALMAAEAEWRAEIEACNAPDAPRIPGEVQCRYCPAKFHCPEARAHVSGLAVIPGGTILTVSNDELSKLLDRSKMASKLIEEIEAEAKRRLEVDPGCVPGYALAPGRASKPISDLSTVFTRCSLRGITPEKFTAACKITKKELTELLKTASGTKGKALDGIIEEVIAGCVEEKTTAKTLKRIG